MPDALSLKNGDYSIPSFSATAAMISGSRGTNKNATENPKNAIPNIETQSSLLS